MTAIHCRTPIGRQFDADRVRGKKIIDLIPYFHNYGNMESKDAALRFAALSQESRVEILGRLVKAGPDGVHAGGLAAHLNMPAPTMSFHLKELQNAGLISSRRDGRRVIYAADYGGLRALIDFMMADCCQGDPRLCGPYIVTAGDCNDPVMNGAPAVTGP